MTVSFFVQFNIMSSIVNIEFYYNKGKYLLV